MTELLFLGELLLKYKDILEACCLPHDAKLISQLQVMSISVDFLILC